SDCATAQVRSVLPLSAIVTRAVHGKADRRYPTSRRTLVARSRSSFRTGITISTCGETSLMPVSVKPLDERPLRRGSEIALSQLRLCASYPAAEPSVQNHPERTRFSAPPASARRAAPAFVVAVGGHGGVRHRAHDRADRELLVRLHGGLAAAA